MNKITLLSILCLIFSITSCNTDDDNSDNNNYMVTEELLIGKWFFVDVVVNGDIIPYDDHEDCGKDYIEFKENGTLWQMDIWGCEEDFEPIGEYSVLEGNLYINEEEINVIELNSNKFSIKGEGYYDNDEILDEIISNFDR